MFLTKSKAIEITVSLLRVVAGVMFIQHGGMKLFGWFGGMPGMNGPVQLASQVGIAGIMEFFGGILMVVGLLTRPVAFLLSGEMAVAYWMVHAPQGTWPVQNHGEAAVLYCFIFLFYAAYGAGVWSIDAMIWNKKPQLYKKETLFPAGHAPRSAGF